MDGPPELEPPTHRGVDGGCARQPAAAGPECGTEQISVNTDRRRGAYQGMGGEDNWIAKQGGIPSPSYAKVAADGANRTATCGNKTAANANKTAANTNKTAASVSKTTGRAILRRCDIGQKRCYMEKGLSSHRASCLGKKKSSDRREQDASTVNHEAVAASKSKNDNNVKGKRQVVRNTYCRHCDKIFLTSTLEDHYRRKHSRRLSPQGKHLTKDKPEPFKKTGSNGPPAVQPSTSKRAQDLESIPPLRKSAHPGKKNEIAKIPPPARSTVANKVATGGEPSAPKCAGACGH
ncbi:hypothetical protein TNCV_241071 [Trichonephila clavipes]|nr:hypothetical protein TNCV_241071 [Trichonephila clavipes]